MSDLVIRVRTLYERRSWEVRKIKEETRTFCVVKQKTKSPLQDHVGNGDLRFFEIPSPFGTLEVSQIQSKRSHVHRRAPKVHSRWRTIRGFNRITVTTYLVTL